MIKTKTKIESNQFSQNENYIYLTHSAKTYACTVNIIINL